MTMAGHVGTTVRPSRERCKQQVFDAIASVRDPEIDEPVGSLDFVVDVIVDEGDVEVVIQLPTFWCPSNFVFLIAEDMRAAVLGLNWVRRFKIRVVEHFAENEITAGINEGRAFESVFPGQAGGAIEKLRKAFDGKACLMRQRNLVIALQKRGIAAETLLAMTLDRARTQVATDEERQLLAAYLEKREAVGMDPQSGHLVSDLSGRPVSDLNAHLRAIRMIAANAAANGEMCRMLVDARRQIACSAAHMPYMAHIKIQRSQNSKQSTHH